MKKKQKKECRSWEVTCRCTVTKIVICEDCTEEQALNDPFGHAVDEQEIEQEDYEVNKVSPNE